MLYLLFLFKIEHFLRRFWLYNHKTTEKTDSGDHLHIKA
jgi:hypothetical protein